ncbi:MAG: FAD:protein FMN transferase [Zetaproteobacteria bacterium]|nr:FAD:protein FMN transferase [Zetaproteobacteria bacterium]
MQGKAQPVLVAFFLLVGAGFLYRQQATPEFRVFELGGSTMGTTYEVKFVASFAAQQSVLTTLKQEIDLELEKVNDWMSTYRAQSELSRFNTMAEPLEWFPVSEQTAFVAHESLRFHGLTLGAFNPAIGGLVNLWGFGPQATPVKTPDPQQLQAWLHMPKPGYEVSFDPAPRLRKLHPEVYLDFSGIAKGYGVDLVSALLERRGFAHHLVDVGGEMMARGDHLGTPWTVGIEKAAFGLEEHRVQKVVKLRDCAIATSGSYRNYYEREGKRYSHVLNPESGIPIQHKVVSLSVLHETALQADALATGLFVLGLEQVQKLSAEHDLAVYVQWFSDQGELQEWRSGAFERMSAGLSSTPQPNA